MTTKIEETLSLSQDQIENHENDDGRTYSIYLDDGVLVVPSVTTVMNVIEKPALVPWAFNVGIEETFRLFKEMPDDMGFIADHQGVRKMLNTLERTPKERKEDGGRRGTIIHDNLAAVFAGHEIKDVPEIVLPYVAQLKKFLDDYDPIIIASELKVAHIEQKYAGRFDAIIIPQKHPARRRHPSLVGKKVLLDIKTNKDGRVYADQHLPQVEGYKAAYRDMGGEVDEAMVVALGPDKYGVTVSYAHPELFFSIVETYDHYQKMKKANPNGRS